MNYRPSKITTTDLSSDVQIESGSPITVFGIVIANQSLNPQDIEIDDANGVRLIPVAVPANSSVVIDIPFLADNGLSIDSLADGTEVFITVFHSHPGA